MKRAGAAQLQEKAMKVLEESVGALRHICIADMARRQLEQHKAKILSGKPPALSDISINSMISKFKKSLVAVVDGKYEAAVDWCVETLAPPDGVAKKTAAIENIKSWRALLDEIIEKRGGDALLSVESELKNMAKVIREAPPYTDQGELFMKYMADTKATDAVCKGESKVLAAKRALTEMGLADQEKLKNQIARMECDVKIGQSLVAAFGVTVLLSNKAVEVQGQKGKALRTQLESMFVLIVTKGFEVDKSLLDRMAEVVPDQRIAANKMG